MVVRGDGGNGEVEVVHFLIFVDGGPEFLLHVADAGGVSAGWWWSGWRH